MSVSQPGAPQSAPTGAELDRARELLAAAPVIDGHNDLAWEMRNRAGYDFEQIDIAAPQPGLQTDIPRLRAGGVGGQFWSVYVPSFLRDGAAVVATLEQIDFVHAMIRRYPAVFALARSASEVARAAAAGGSPRCSARKAATRSTARSARCACCTRSASGI